MPRILPKQIACGSRPRSNYSFFKQCACTGSANTLPGQTKYQGLKLFGIQFHFATLPNAWPVEFCLGSTAVQTAKHQSRHEPGLSFG